MNRTRTFGAVACAAVLALSVVGCGSSDDKKDDAKALSASDFRDQANDLCKTANVELADIQSSADVTTDEGAKAFVTAFSDRITKLVDGIDELEAPDSLADGVDEMLDAVKAVVSDLEEKGIEALSGDTDPFTEADAKATELGLPDCAGNSDSTPLSSEEFTTQANAICTTFNATIAGLNPADGAAPAAVDAAYKQVGAVFDEEVAQLQALTPPADIADDVTSLLTDVSAGAALLKEKGAAVEQLPESPFTSATTKAKALGLDACTQ